MGRIINKFTGYTGLTGSYTYFSHGKSTEIRKKPVKAVNLKGKRHLHFLWNSKKYEKC